MCLPTNLSLAFCQAGVSWLVLFLSFFFLFVEIIWMGEWAQNVKKIMLQEHGAQATSKQPCLCRKNLFYTEICQEWIKAANILQDPSSRSGLQAFPWGSLLPQSTLLSIWLTPAAVYFALHRCFRLCPEVRMPPLLIVDPGCIPTLSVFHFSCFLWCLAWPVGGPPTVGLTLRGAAHFTALQCLYQISTSSSRFMYSKVN